MTSVAAALTTRRKRKSRKIFLSYRRCDSADISGRLYDRLVLKYGTRRVFKDVYSIPPGVDFGDYIDEVIPECTALLAIIGPDWSTGRPNAPRSLRDADDFVRRELACALAHGIPIIPVLVGGARLPAARQLPKELRKLPRCHAIELRGDPHFHRDVDDLLTHL